MNKLFKKSEALLKKAETIIPLGAQTFSKSKTQYPLGASPFFATHAKGAYLYDVDKRPYLDFVNSLAAITLGYQDPDVLDAVKTQLEKGTIFSLSSELETKVAELVCEIVPCAEMVRFGKNGSDATSAAIRIARSYTQKDHICVCGYHGWHDWYIASTTKDSGIPKAVADLTHSFAYNNLNALETLFHKFPNQIAAVIMEPVNVAPPNIDFLEKVKVLAHQHNALLIFDETITGFRFANGGAQEFFNVTPDLATFGKGIANGFPLSAVAGKKEYMMEMEKIFFSSTFGGETLSLAAGFATLKKLQSHAITDHLWKIGTYLTNQLNTLICDKIVDAIFKLKGYDVWSFLTIQDQDFGSKDEIKTLLLQELFKSNILSLGTHNISYAHTKKDIDTLISVYSDFFDLINTIKNGQSSIQEALTCDVINPLFKVR